MKWRYRLALSHHLNVSGELTPDRIKRIGAHVAYTISLHTIVAPDSPLAQYDFVNRFRRVRTERGFNRLLDVLYRICDGEGVFVA